ncbi:DNA-directed RNA polymerase subunit beta [Ureaplasma miroungigenitalium]|uniref:DNA-directed RNA polymerase subunit beta n=5 Tax=Ureaplasma miroungigenitalium TaxID=1042321 RepID=A0ABT3BMI0_9BACT|nr:DNA-directed RNA polymerase subunit beta [Ureaplasma miroungigenitalium]MCV3728434.1 DNA-directed RNA polymerase subunit beta [Ureaplasma miroungigenitalium]
MNQNYREKQITRKTVRRDYSKTKLDFEGPNLLQVQVNSFARFMEKDLREVVANIFPLNSPQGRYTLKFVDLKVKEPIKSERACRNEGKTYETPVYIDLQLVDNVTGEVKKVQKSKKRDEEGMYLGAIPKMTEQGTFIINGIEKFVISQIVRSPGIYVLSKSAIKLNGSRKRLFEGRICEIFPSKGTLMLGFLPKDKEFVQIVARDSSGDNAIAFSITTILKAFGLTTKEILNIYGNEKEIIESLAQEKYNDKEIFESSIADETISKMMGEINEYLDKNDHKSTEELRSELITLNTALIGKLKVLVFDYLVASNKLDDLLHDNNNEESAEFKKANKKLYEEIASLVEEIISEKAAKDIVESLAINIKNTEYLKTLVDNRQISYQLALQHHFFNKRLYDISSAGRYKFEKKLLLTERLFMRVVAEDILTKDNTVLVPKNTLITKEHIELIKEASKTNNLKWSKKINLLPSAIDSSLKQYFDYEAVDVYKDNDKRAETTRIIGVGTNNDLETLTISDLVAVGSYIYNLNYDIGDFDEVDHLGNKRLKLIHELLRARVATSMSRIEKFINEKLAISDGSNTNIANYTDNANLDEDEKNELEEEKKRAVTVKSIVNTKQFQTLIKDFFNSHQLIQFIDQQNPLAELTNKRRISAMGPGGISREDPNLDIRDVHHSHYSRICPIETPEGMNIGLIMSLASLAKVDENGFIVAPYFKVNNGVVTQEHVYLTAHEDDNFIISESAVNLDENFRITNEQVVCRYRGSTGLFKPEQVDYIDIVPRQVVSIAASAIPFIENDDGARALMGSNMQRQSVPLIKPYAPIVGTGTEYKIAHDSGMAVVSKTSGTISYVDAQKIVVTDENETDHTYELIKYRKSNQDTCNNQTPIVSLNQKVSANETIADGPAMQNGELALGRNVLVGYTTWSGYNFEDAIIISERLVSMDVFTSIHIDELTLQCVKTKNGDEEITRDMPNVSDHAKRFLDKDGIVFVGAEVHEGDVLVGKTTPRGNIDVNPEDKLLQTIFGDKSKSVKDSSMKVKHGQEGIVAAVKRIKATDANNNELPDDVLEIVKIYIVQKRKIQVGDKMAGRHGNKGIVSKVVPIQDMPFLADGTPLDIMLNPLGVPSRMNIGQILELHLGYAASEIGKKQLINIPFKNEGYEKYVSLFGLTDIVAERLYNKIQDFIKNKNITDPKQIDVLDQLIILNSLGLSFDDVAIKVATPVFDGVKTDDLVAIMNEAEIDIEEKKGKQVLYDGRTGDAFDGLISIGHTYMLKLDHMVDDKIHSRSVGPYSKITQQPLGGKSQNGGQRFGEMEVWALEAYGAAYNLLEILTIKSDDVQGRNQAYNAIIKNRDITSSGMPESFNLLTKQIQGLALCMSVETDEGEIDINEYTLNDYKRKEEELDRLDEEEHQQETRQFVIKNNFDENRFDEDEDDLDLLEDNF